MKKIVALLLVVVTVVSIIYLSKSQTKTEYLRIHIRANSNISADQDVKYKIKDKVVDALVPYLANCQTLQQSKKTIEDNFGLIESVANSVLYANGFSYTAKAKICNEKFPTRSYGDLTLEEGFYDALILELGQATGDNWWCVVYPPLCFVNTNNQNVVYKSRIMEIIQKILG